MKERIEEHLLLLLGNKPVGYFISEQRLYMLMFLNEGRDESGKYRNNLFHFQRGKELPYSDRLFRAFRNPRYFKMCWVIDEHRGCYLTETGRKKFAEMITKGKTKRFKNISVEYAEIFLKTQNTTDYELEKIIQLKFFKWIEVGGVDPTQEAPENPFSETVTHGQLKSIYKKGDVDTLSKIADSYDHVTQQIRQATFLHMAKSKQNVLSGKVKLDET